MDQPTYLTELDPKYAQMIFKAKMEMFDIKTNFKACIYQICYAISVMS